MHDSPLFNWRQLYLASVIVVTAALFAEQAAAELTLQRSEELALAADPAVVAGQARARALQAQAVADGQLPDPKLLMGVWNVPLDDFSMKKEAGSQWRTGIRQSFPRGNSLEYRQRRGEWLSKAETSATRDTRSQIQRDVRQNYLELFYQDRAAHIIEQTHELFAQLVDITRAHYASGRVSQQDVLQAQLELSRLDDRISRINEQRDIQQAALSRWIGDTAWQNIDTRFPVLPDVPGLSVLQAILPEHPGIRSANAEVEASQQSVREAREQYKPGFDVGVEYRKRFGNDMDGSDRPDQMAAMVTLDLPLFTAKRQDQRLSASQQKKEAAIQAREQKLRELQRTLAADHARWRRLEEQLALYDERLLSEARANAEAALTAYQSGLNEFNTLMRARITELDIRLQRLRLWVDRAKTQARLLYLGSGRTTPDTALQGDLQ